MLHLQDGTIGIQLDYKGTGNGGRLKVTIEDSGEGFDYKNLENGLSGDVPYAGRGINLMRSICHSIEYLGSGNVVCASFVWGDS